MLWLSTASSIHERIHRRRFLELLVDLKNECLDTLNVMIAVVAHVRNTIDIQNDVGDIGDGHDGLIRHGHHTTVLHTIHIDHRELTPVDVVRKLLVLHQQPIAMLTLVRIEQDQR